MTASLWDKVTFGRTGLSVSRLAIGSSYGVGGKDLERARERGVSFYFWGLRRTRTFAEGLRSITRTRREELCIAIQSYSRSALLVRPSVELALRRLRLEYVDVLTLGWWNAVPPDRIVDAALALKEKGKVKHVMVSCHHRPSFPDMIADPRFDAIMLRYNAAHPGAEREVFPRLAGQEQRPGVLAFTATRWGSLLNPKFCPPEERTPSATDCYRFVLSNPDVNVSLAGPKDGAELDQALTALDLGVLDAEEMAWMRRVGASVHQRRRTGGPVSFLDSLSSFFAGRRRDADPPLLTGRENSDRPGGVG